MKKLISRTSFPALPLVFGGIGLLLRIWLYSARDELGLFPAGHISTTLLLILTALVLATVLLAARRASPDGVYREAFPATTAGCIGTLVMAAGVLYSCVTEFLSRADVLAVLLLPLGLAATGMLIAAAITRRGSVRPPFFTYCILTGYLMLHVMAQCRVWGTEPQLVSYGFHLLASIFLMLTGYHRTALTIGKGDYAWYLFFSQTGIFLSCLVLNTESCLFYLPAILWLVLDHPKVQEV